MRERVEAHSPWVLASVVVVALACGIVAIVNDVINAPRFESQLSTITRLLSTRADVPADPITSDTQLGQTFRADQGRLSEVGVMLATYGRKNDVPVVFKLWMDPPGREPLRTVVAPPETISDNAFHEFEFEPITDSGGQRYLLTVESPEATATDAFTAWLGKCDCYPDGKAFLNASELQGRELAFKVGYHDEVPSMMKGLMNRLSQYKPWFFKGGLLALPGLATLGIALFAVGYVTAGLMGERKGLLQWAWTPAWGLTLVAASVWLLSQ